MKSAIVDPSFLIGLFDESDPLHRRCRAFLRTYPGCFLTTEAALTQTLAVLSFEQQLRCLEWLGKAAQAGLLAVGSEPIDLGAVENLARKRAGRPLDLAEATLVLLAERTGVSEFLAAGRRDFGAYGLDHRARFIELPKED